MWRQAGRGRESIRVDSIGFNSVTVNSISLKSRRSRLVEGTPESIGHTTRRLIKSTPVQLLSTHIHWRQPVNCSAGVTGRVGLGHK